ncbi:MAG TPA: ACP phosphodiesterase [Chitinophagaceae bacterium]|nr:ACP phosphodiesterase [Chitinophagaceae bacterium]
MNYLAHAYLSFHHPEITVGNLISDFVKGKKKFDYPINIQKGITLHRDIDAFTDVHAATKEAKKVFQPHYRLYSGAFVDVVYDHFLACDTKEFSGDLLLKFSNEVYSILEKYLHEFPDGFANMFPYMKRYNWLLNYRTQAGVEKSFWGIVHRAAYLAESDTAYRLFKDNYQLLQDCYRPFWKEIKPYAKDQFIALANLENNL